MNSAHPVPEPSSYTRNLSDSDIKRMVASSFQILDKPTPPTLREILAAYRANGDGDRDMLLAMLNAKAAEDQRIAAMANLHRTVLDVYQNSFEPLPTPRSNGDYHYPTPSFTQSPPLCEQRQSRRSQYSQVSSRSRSPRVRSHLLPHRDAHFYHEPPRKRHRGSHSPPPTHAGAYDSHPEATPLSTLRGRANQWQ
ncbi:hypothetical protein AGABI1DRAFT_110115 [Agaricus bisporus var. burnettii JB137-S8]|uniref:Uncharacterized protein n=2 Tax=Agaricus bisporus var. burnettii TaxID=192524 RepID=K5W9B0_AGABU|nr:uncharacterized protein AGABI1DRAFT_110115 [Agaricus bisporus var. burnettii JB137-S8]EKM83454.1 hypothetical protein AGABI1DRAFT_110115 [Agaricus bisporus var. burnettii JB137-S8]KAF7785088.1 hypothetical protein Agabi119p4_1253 [Agaricus bisporus var. burnettii]